MLIRFHYMRGAPGSQTTSVSASGETLIIDGEEFEFLTPKGDPLPEGAVATPKDQHPNIKRVSRIEGELVCEVILYLGDDAETHQDPNSENHEVTVFDGPANPPIALKEAQPQMAQNSEEVAQ